MSSQLSRRLSGSPHPKLGPALAAVAIAAGVTGLPTLAGAAAAAPAAKGTVITTTATAYGRYLVAGSGPFAGYTLYYITSDHGHTFGCTAKEVTLPEGSIQCTGPSDDQNAEWPAITTSGRPVAAGGVVQRLLGTVRRTGVGEQVTYAGHPLYLFDRGPGQVTGEGWDEPSVPPWHGVWYLMAPSGHAVAPRTTMTTMRIGGRAVLAIPRETLAGVVDFPLYSYSRDTAGHSACTNACARAWPPLLTSGHPHVSRGLSATRFGVLSRLSGTQVRYRGKPLYMFGYEGVVPTAGGPANGGGIEATGSGQGITVAGGTFELVTP